MHSPGIPRRQQRFLGLALAPVLRGRGDDKREQLLLGCERQP